jgi:hypothetical protein
MTDIAFENRRFDPDSTPFHDLAKAMAKAFGYTADLALDQHLAQLVRLRVAHFTTASPPTSTRPRSPNSPRSSST